MAFVYIAANVKNGKGSPAIVKKAFGTAAKVTRPTDQNQNSESLQSDVIVIILITLVK